MVNKCRYCGKEWKRLNSSGFEICKCKKAQIEWEISMRIQEYQRCLNNAKKELSDLKDSVKSNQKGVELK